MKIIFMIAIILISGLQLPAQTNLTSNLRIGDQRGLWLVTLAEEDVKINGAHP